jgi:hypothetical protein
MQRGRWKGLLLLAVWLLAPAAAARAQTIIDDVEDLDWDRPEAWAMKYFNSVAVMTSLGPVESREPGSLELAAEAGWIPHLDEEQRTVGFNGTKEEDLNKLPVFGRIRAIIGLPSRFSLEVGVSPPVEVSGVKATLFALAIQRPFYEKDSWSLGLRLSGQTGKIEGDFTCPKEILEFEPGSDENRFGCEAKSADTANLDHVGLELNAAHRFKGSEGPVIHFGLGANYMDTKFEVNALTFGVLDRSVRLADGVTYSLTTGANFPVARKTALGLELFYSPLSVQRPGDESNENDPLFNVRGMVRYRF